MLIMFWLSAYTNIRSVLRIIMRLKLNKNQITCYDSCFPKSELCHFVTEKFVTSRVRRINRSYLLGINYTFIIALGQSLRLMQILNHC